MTVQQIAQQMRDYATAWRAQGISQANIGWIEYWANQLLAAQSYPLYPSYPNYLYDTFFIPGLPLRQAGTFNIEVNRGFTVLR